MHRGLKPHQLMPMTGVPRHARKLREGCASTPFLRLALDEEIHAYPSNRLSINHPACDNHCRNFCFPFFIVSRPDIF